MLTNFKTVKHMFIVKRVILSFPSLVACFSFIRSRNIIVPIINSVDSFENILNKCYIINCSQKSLVTIIFLVGIFFKAL